MKWADSNECMEILGVKIKISNRSNVTYQNISWKIQSLKNIITMWSARHLSLYGKNIILKTFCLSNLVYIFTNMPCVKPEVIKELEKISFRFLWDNKPDKIKRNTMYLSFDMCGLQVKNILFFEKSLKMSWVKRLCSDVYSNWKELVYHQFPIVKHLKNVFFNCNLSHTDFLKMFCAPNVNVFWKDVFTIWCDFNHQKPIMESKHLRGQILWLNSYIRIQNKPVFYLNWFNAGCKTLNDLLDDEGRILIYEEFIRKYNIHCNFLTYQGLVDAIPREWKRVLSEVMVPVDFCYTYFAEKFCKSISSTKFAYKYYIDRISVDLSRTITKWNTDLGINIDVEHFRSAFIKLSQATISTTFRSFQFRFLHRAVKTNTFAALVGATDSALCSFCHITDETLLHLFWDCNITKRFWSDLFNFIFEEYRVRILFSKKDVLLCCEVNLFNLLFIVAKHYIYTCKCLSTIPDIQSYVRIINNVRKMEEDIANRQGNIQLHNLKWNVT
jgi:hypothetical protein